MKSFIQKIENHIEVSHDKEKAFFLVPKNKKITLFSLNGTFLYIKPNWDWFVPLRKLGLISKISVVPTLQLDNCSK